MKLLLVDESNKGFHSKLRERATSAFTSYGYQVLHEDLSDWKSVFDRAKKEGVERIHLDRLLDPVRLASEINEASCDVTFLVMGIGEYTRDDKKREAMVYLSSHPKIKNIYLLSIDPESAQKYSRDSGYLNSEKVLFRHEPPYEDKNFYREITKQKARKVLGLDQVREFVLYYGSYWFSKGADLLLEAATRTPDVAFLFVGDTKVTSLNDGVLDKYRSKSNIFFIDEFVSEETARNYFRACDIVALPYRKFYKHDTSGVFNQAMLANKPVVMPDFDPFLSIWNKYIIGRAFEAESVTSLMDEIIVALDHVGSFIGFDLFLRNAGTWEEALR